jgi:NAD(P)H-dependent flavin oxidoreductase YrpB (nitropropane dioxygenase family)
MIETRVCQLLNIKYPIVQAAMAWVSDAKMVAAISNAGGLGTVGPNAGSITITRDPHETRDRLRAQIRKVRELTDKPFAANVLVPGPGEEEFSEECTKVTIEEGVPVAVVSQGSPEFYTERLKKAGMKVLHVVANPRHAQKAEAAGVDAVITSGTEGGGHSGLDLLTTFVLVPLLADAVKIPIIAGGGVGNGRGLVAALALGAEGIYMGTRFIATKECRVHQNWKQALVQGEATDTVSIRHGRASVEEMEDVQTEMRFGTVRMLLNEYAQGLARIEAEGRSPEEIMKYYSSPPSGYEGKDVSRTMLPVIYGDVAQGGVAAGQVVGLIKDIPTCQELIGRIVSDAEKILERLSAKKLKPR